MTPSDGRYAWTFTVLAQDVELWRKEIGAAVSALGGESEVLETVQLGVSELLANVLAHVADPVCRLEVLRDGCGICVRLFDHSREVPAVLAPDGEAERGRGLWLLREMADGLGYVLTASGKCVWFRVAVPCAGRVAA
jgi:serine/threonine-protein kinase RsbW